MRAGVDEVGRGPFAGPVMVCVFATDLSDDELTALFPKGVLRDSKKLSEKRRGELFLKLKKLQEEKKVAWELHGGSAKEIDLHGVGEVIKASVTKGVRALLEKNVSLTHIYLDGGLYAKEFSIPQETANKGDESFPVIACASVIAKVTRDTLMKELADTYPGYSFEKNAGYGTKEHIEAIKRLGLTEIHRKSFIHFV